ncbi:hypothetical protein HHI36_006912 [Cryptolaemus montrouzieri]|uniref:EF-hand domain-containing protein n=1 Tax=Cryptolaemus montrouzieri TaxID=559131 RepID=A0ABD2MMZ5_9CUCU
MVADILRLMGQPFDKKILEELIEEVDADKSGRLEFEEFVTLAAKFIVEEDDEAMQKELKEAFRLYDKEGNGYIPTSCLKEILRELDDQLTDRELQLMIEEIDTDGSGTVDFDEFMEMMTGKSEAFNRIHVFNHTGFQTSKHLNIICLYLIYLQYKEFDIATMTYLRKCPMEETLKIFLKIDKENLNIYRNMRIKSLISLFVLSVTF